MTKDGWKLLSIISSLAGLILSAFLINLWGKSQERCFQIKEKSYVDSVKYTNKIDSLQNYINAMQIVGYWNDKRK